MDKRDLVLTFRERLRALLARSEGGLARFARETGVDRSALGQFLDPACTRLPRAETLRALAERKGVTVDWLLGLSNAPEGGQALASSVEIETAVYADGGTPLERWRREAAGAKLRYVPSTLPDMLRLPEIMAHELEGPRASARLTHGEAMLGDALLGETDVEIAMPQETLDGLAEGAGIWRDAPAALRRRQLERMAELVEAHYPALRLHLYDGRRTFSPPFTVFGGVRAALYLGRAYLVLTNAEQVRALSRHFDQLVREALIGAERTHERLAALAQEAREI